MAQITANNIKIEAESFGPAGGETVLLIMGLGGQLTRWPLPLVEMLTAKGYRVIRFDNRDVGLSEHFEKAGPISLADLMSDMAAGRKPRAAYLLDDMAADAVGVLDAFGVKRAQMVAANHGERTLSLVSIMSSTGNRALPPATPEAMAVLTTRADPSDFEKFVAHGIRAQKIIGSPGYPPDETQLRERIISDFHRAYDPDGVTRQMAAVMASGDRRAALKRIKAPTVVLHGADDPLVPLAGGKDTAENIAGAELRVIPGMGHDLPPALFPAVVDAIEAAAARARAMA